MRRIEPANAQILAALIAITALSLTACGGGAATASSTTPSTTPATSGTSSRAPASAPGAPVRLPVNGRFDYQIGGPYAPVASMTVVDRDRHERPVSGRYSICYVNAFQTQPEDKAFWIGSHRDLLVQQKGKPVTDPGWPGEYLLDTSTAAKRKALAAIENPWIDGCARSGFQAVEPDNLDSWTRSKRGLDRADNVAFAKLLAAQAHAAGLAIAQKNTSELGATGRTQVGFDFAIAEECEVYDECGDYTDVYGARVIEIEYTDNPRSAYTRACTARGKQIAVILRDRDVVARGQRGYHFEGC